MDLTDDQITHLCRFFMNPIAIDSLRPALRRQVEPLCIAGLIEACNCHNPECNAWVLTQRGSDRLQEFFDPILELLEEFSQGQIKALGVLLCRQFDIPVLPGGDRASIPVTAGQMEELMELLTAPEGER